jgi:hypothetical protein
MNRYDWDKLDEKAKFAWTEPDGEQWQAAERPVIDGEGWYVDSGWCRLIKKERLRCKDWRSSLEERPNNINQEPIKVGDTFGKYTVVFIDHGGVQNKFLCVLPWEDGYSSIWFHEEGLRGASA